jgi:hypothetical protein
MKERIVPALHRAENRSGIVAADWRLVSEQSFAQERYYVKRDVEIAREVEEQRYALTLYVDHVEGEKKFRGEASISLQPSHSDAEIEARIGQGLFAASLSKNPWFELPGPAKPKVSIPVSDFASMEESARMDACAQAFYSPEGRELVAGGPSAAGQPRINCLELFVTKTRKSFENSRGAAFDIEGWKGYSEFIVDTDSSQGKVELFDDLSFSDPDAERLAAATGSRLAQVRDRALAIPTPALNGLPLILGGREAEEIFGWFFDNASTSAIFMKASPFSVGANIQEDGSRTKIADPLDIFAEALIPGLPASSSFDPDGFPLEQVPVVEKGILTRLVGGLRYADWLGEPRRGAYSLFSVSPGIMSLAEMRAQPHLEAAVFSDFRLESATGDFGGEIRLAYWFDGKTRRPVTGGSISGSVAELRSTMLRSKERGLAARSLCPKAVLLKGVSITGAL